VPSENGIAGAGIKPGTTLGATDDFGYFITEGKRTCHDLQQRLIGPEGDAKVRRELLA
jgi:hypothetical protein